MSARRFTLAILFVLLATFLGLDWVAHRSGISPAQISEAWRSAHQSRLAVVGVILLSLGLYLCDAFRYRAFGRAFAAEISFAKSLRAATTCFLFSWTSPYGMLGPPASAFSMNQDGSSWDEALLVSYGKSLTGAVFLLLVASALIAAGFLPGGMTSPSSFFLLASLGFYALVLCAKPMRARLNALARAGTGALVAVLISHVLYFGAWIAVCVLWAVALGAKPDLALWAISCLFVTLLYMSPTPSGAGVAELVAVPFFGHLMSPASALVFVTLFRASTYGLQIALGLAYFVARGGWSTFDLARGARLTAPV